VEIGAYLPNIVPEPLDRKTFLAWCRRIDLFFVPATRDVGVLDELCAALDERKVA
jgi:hypothetical protein